ncbi:MAG: GTP 3',8-cyclase MoaA [Rickettsiaceae bacterium]|nr:GTP 3',8-cyclase MoaA [Rickettsiaceae bacterium]
MNDQRSNNNSQLKDTFGRKFYYLRLSITDLCNFRCNYCLPDGCGHIKPNYISINEIKNLCTAFAELGMNKIRLTGGEPTLRKDFIEIVKVINSINNINTIALTTNAYKLEKYALDYVAAGITNINISMDSLDQDIFKEITGHDKLKSVKSGIQAVIDAGCKNIKINAVLLKGYNSHTLNDFLYWIKDKHISVRFIELMQTGTNKAYFDKHHVSASFIENSLLKENWTIAKRQINSGPAIEYEHKEYKGKIGIIAPYSPGFCDSCNRLRVSSQGELYLCLFAELGYSLRSLMQNENQKETLKNAISKVLLMKERSHDLLNGKYGNNQHFAAIGG